MTLIALTFYVFATVAVLAGIFQQIGLSEPLGLDNDPSPLIVWLAAQPIFVRCLISLPPMMRERSIRNV